MFRSACRLLIVASAALALMSFSMKTADTTRAGGPVYDVRGSFVAAKPDIPAALVAGTDRRIDAAIRATVRSMSLPRAILTVRITRAGGLPILFGRRHEAKVTVDATSVTTGERIASATFTVSTTVFGKDRGGDEALAAKIADRVAAEFKLDGGRQSTIASALAGR
ncbi:hypothetical protein J2T09_001441 [Neorhizobium huautlense]|uniref:Uncharacterized protein n=1 Tax=Neorhizobium huautlense TaxID=67774 RepID=A0ABT9PQE7_9HYPH|nr:hypothetical protein [Neorhizobium huautlense]MDP9836696.1 hypothetical protein [Neorhizobium huautlense]